MASGSGPSLGHAILNLVAPPAAGWQKQLAYVTGAKTGVSLGSAARQIGVLPRTLRRWISGQAAPSKRSQGKLTGVYERFWRIDHRGRPPERTATAVLKISAKPLGAITIQGRERSSILVEKGRRDWSGVMAARTPDEAYEAFVAGVIGPSPLPAVEDGYLEFDDGDYTVETV